MVKAEAEAKAAKEKASQAQTLADKYGAQLDEAHTEATELREQLEELRSAAGKPQRASAQAQEAKGEKAGRSEWKNPSGRDRVQSDLEMKMGLGGREGAEGGGAEEAGRENAELMEPELAAGEERLGGGEGQEEGEDVENVGDVVHAAEADAELEPEDIAEAAEAAWAEVRLMPECPDYSLHAIETSSRVA